jgi:lipopolysaccharide/colanic/teichoic acid biosynthesis glycosyltransferase
MIDTVSAARDSEAQMTMTAPATLKNPESAEPGPISAALGAVLGEAAFHHRIALERKRTERSGTPFVLMLLGTGDSLPLDKSGRVLGNILAALSLSTRETDIIGWYRDQSVVGVLFTGLSAGERDSILGTMMNRVSGALRDHLSLEKFSQIGISLHVFPEDWDQETTVGNPTLYPDYAHRDRRQKFALIVKRTFDIAGSAAALVALSPLFFVLAALVKFSSKGPVLFKQQRLGQFGKPFTFLKFRSMYVNNDAAIHAEFMRRVIKGHHDGSSEAGSRPVYKMTRDPRITRVGRILRRWSLDELPQFVNVLRGEMSLVGPRPALAYECQEYAIWHRRRVLEVKPGLTGLWQINGRSRVRFDEMVRQDLQYVRTWSLWLDLKILLKTPAALFSDDAF